MQAEADTRFVDRVEERNESFRCVFKEGVGEEVWKVDIRVV